MGIASTFARRATADGVAPPILRTTGGLPAAMRANGGPLNEPHRPPIIIVGKFAIKFARNSRVGRAKTTLVLRGSKTWKSKVQRFCTHWPA
jgi:hypothetical protein